MKYLIYIFIGLLGVWLGRMLGAKRAGRYSVDKELKEMRESARKAVTVKVKDRKQVIFQYAQRQGRITNNEAEAMFCISDSTAEKYLDELEKEGKLKQIGKSGRGVYYVPKTPHLAKK